MPTEIEPCFYKHFTGCDGEINTNRYTTIISEFCSELTVSISVGIVEVLILMKRLIEICQRTKEHIVVNIS